APPPAAGRRHRRAGVDQVDALAPDQGPQPAGPAGPLGPIQAVDREPGPGEPGGQAVLPGQQGGELVAVALGVQGGDAAQQELLGPAAAEALDDDQDTGHAAATSS